MKGLDWVDSGTEYDLRCDYCEFRNKYISPYVFHKTMKKLNVFYTDDWGFVYADYEAWEDLIGE